MSDWAQQYGAQLAPGVELTTRPEGTFWPATATTDGEGRARFALLATPDAPFAPTLSSVWKTTNRGL